MKRQFFAIILLLISFSFVFSTKSFAITCGDDNTNFVCGVAGGCQSGQMCVAGNILQGRSGYKCLSGDNIDCSIQCGDAGTIGQCGTISGCPTGNACGASGCYPATCVNEPTPSIIDCSKTENVVGCQGLPCLYNSNNVGYCGDGYYCEGGTCQKEIVSLNNSVNIGPYCKPGDKDSGIRTAFGCIKFSNDNASNDLVIIILRLATGIGGGIALALILYGVFIVTTSAGMPDKLKAGSEIITSAVIGLIFILLSVFLVNLIGINILGIPGLS